MIEKTVRHKNNVEFDSELPLPPSKRCNGLLIVQEITGILENFLYLGNTHTFIHTFSMKFELLSNKIETKFKVI